MTRRQSNNHWNGGIAAHPAPKIVRVQKSAGKVVATMFWSRDAIVLIDYLPKGQTVNAESYSSLLVKLKDILKETRREAGKSPRGSCSCTTMSRLCNAEETGLPGLLVS